MVYLMCGAFVYNVVCTRNRQSNRCNEFVTSPLRGWAPKISGPNASPPASILVLGGPTMEYVRTPYANLESKSHDDPCKSLVVTSTSLTREAIDVFKAAHFKHQPTPITAFVGSAVALGGLEMCQSFLIAEASPELMVLIGSSAALATLLFAAPAAPLGTPWNSILGHIISITVALLLHWLQLLTGLNLFAKVLVPSVSIALMAHWQVTNPPAAAAAFIFVTNDKAKSQALGGAFFLLMPALLGCAWLFLCQYGLAGGLAYLKARAAGAEPPRGAAPKASVVVNTVDPAVATCIIQAVEGAAYVEDSLSYLIETLTQDRARLQRQRAVLRALTGKKEMGQSEAAGVIQKGLRKVMTAKRLEMSASPAKRHHPARETADQV